MITFGDGAHSAMIEMLQDAAGAQWLVEPLREGQQPDRPDSTIVKLNIVDKTGMHGWILGEDGVPAEGMTTFDWITYPHVHVS